MTSMPPILERTRAILFDMDGVLIDSEPIHEQAIVALSSELGEKLTDPVTINSFKGAPEKFMARRLREIYPDMRLTDEELIQRKVHLYAGLFSKVTLIGGALEFLEKSHAAGRKHGLTTSASRSTQELSFRTFGFSPLFDAVVTGEDIIKGKPDPEPYLITAGKLGIDPKECFVIEDSINGIRSGKAAGCTVIALTTTFPRTELFKAGADQVIDFFSELDL